MATARERTIARLRNLERPIAQEDWTGIGNLVARATAKGEQWPRILPILEPLVTRITQDPTGMNACFCMEAVGLSMHAHWKLRHKTEALELAVLLLRHAPPCLEAMRANKDPHNLVVLAAKRVFIAGVIFMEVERWQDALDALLLMESFCQPIVERAMKQKVIRSEEECTLFEDTDWLVRQAATNIASLYMKTNNHAAGLKRMEAIVFPDGQLNPGLDIASNLQVFRVLGSAYSREGLLDKAYATWKLAFENCGLGGLCSQDGMVIACGLSTALRSMCQHARSLEVFTRLLDQGNAYAQRTRYVTPDEKRAGLVADYAQFCAFRKARRWHNPQDTEAWRVCNACDTVYKDMAICAGCMRATYCNKECQRADWSKHREQCDVCERCECVIRAKHVPKCGHCKFTRYCSWRCRAADWPKHKVNCDTYRHFREQSEKKAASLIVI